MCYDILLNMSAFLYDMGKYNIAWQNFTCKAPVILFCSLRDVRQKYLIKFVWILIQQSDIHLKN